MALTSTIDVSAGAKAAIARALDELSPYDGDPRLAALISKLAQIADPVVTKADRIAGELMRVHKAADELGPLGLEERAGVAKATKAAQLRYLREVSPAAYDRLRQGGHAA